MERFWRSLTRRGISKYAAWKGKLGERSGGIFKKSNMKKIIKICSQDLPPVSKQDVEEIFEIQLEVFEGCSVSP